MRWLLPLLLVVTVSAQAAPDLATEKAAPAFASEINNAETAEVPAEPVKGMADTRKESEIPLNLEAPKKAASEDSGIFRILFTLSILGIVGVGAFFFLRKYSVPKAMKQQTQIKVLQQHYLGPKKSLAIVRVAGESILIGVTDHNISMIKSLSLLDDEVPEEAPQSFGKVLGSKSNFKDSDDNDRDDDDQSTPPRKRSAKDLDMDEEFAISGIKDIVSKRLKGMRSFQ